MEPEYFYEKVDEDLLDFLKKFEKASEIKGSSKNPDRHNPDRL